MVKVRVLLLVAARGGSKGVKNKNIRELCGLPLIAHTILQAKRWGKADRIVCSTDSQGIADIAKEFGAEVPFMRPEELAGDHIGKHAVLRHALKSIEQITKEEFPVIIDLDVTAPVRKISDIEGVYQLFTEKRPKCVFSVTSCRRNPYYNMVEINPQGFAALVKPGDVVLKRRQDAPRVYDMNASIYAYDRDYLLDKNSESAISEQCLVWVMDELSAFDIDRECDFQFIEFLVSKGLVTL